MSPGQRQLHVQTPFLLHKLPAAFLHVPAVQLLYAFIVQLMLEHLYRALSGCGEERVMVLAYTSLQHPPVPVSFVGVQLLVVLVTVLQHFIHYVLEGFQCPVKLVADSGADFGFRCELYDFDFRYHGCSCVAMYYIYLIISITTAHERSLHDRHRHTSQHIVKHGQSRTQNRPQIHIEICTERRQHMDLHGGGTSLAAQCQCNQDG